MPATPDAPPRRARAAGVAGAVWGIAVLAGAHRLGGRAPAAVVLARLLGVRYVVQGVALTVTPRPPVRIVQAVDALHAISMLALLGSARYRRPALLSAAIATGLAVLAGTGPHSTVTATRR
jgi:hypothetical protein